MSTRRRLLMAMCLKKPRLPREFQEVEFLESTGTQYIDTGIIPQNHIGIKAKISLSYNIDFNCLISAGETDQQLIFLMGTSISYFKYFAQGNASSFGFSYIINNIHNIEITKNGNILINGRIYASSEYQEPISSNLYLLRRTDGTQWFYGKLYSCKIYDNDVIVRNYVPCYRKSDDVAGLYDLVNDVFYTNAGTGQFIVGGDVR